MQKHNFIKTIRQLKKKKQYNLIKYFFIFIAICIMVVIFNIATMPDSKPILLNAKKVTMQLPVVLHFPVLEYSNKPIFLFLPLQNREYIPATFIQIMSELKKSQVVALVEVEKSYVAKIIEWRMKGVLWAIPEVEELLIKKGSKYACIQEIHY